MKTYLIEFESCFFGIWAKNKKIVNERQLSDLANTVGIAILSCEEVYPVVQQ